MKHLMSLKERARQIEAQALSRSVAQGTVQVKHSREEDGKTVAENF